MKFALGTVQLGMAYGIANIIGQPSSEEALEILRKSYENGIKMYDTSAIYGTSEDRLGEFISEYNLNGMVEISAKVRLNGARNLQKQVSDNIRNTLERLNIDTIDYYLLQYAVDISKNGQRILENFIEQKENGLVKKIGVSIEDVNAIEYCLEYHQKYHCIDVLQIPFNVLDVRLIENGLLKEMSEMGIEIHARNIYLQGLITMEGELPEYVAKAHGYLNWLTHIANQELHMEVRELAFLYVRDNPYIRKMILGCETVEQLMQNIEYNKKPALDESVIKHLEKSFRGVPEDILTPSQW